MRKLKFFVPIIALGILSGCSKVKAGYEGVIVDLYGSSKGVQSRTVGPGRYWTGINKELFLFPTFLQNYTWTKEAAEGISIQTDEGLNINADVGITYQIPVKNVSQVFQKYREGVKEITNVFLRNMVRDAMNKVASKMSVDDLVGKKKDEFILAVNKLVKEEAKSDGILVDKIYLIGSFRLPPNVINSINAKIQANQNALKVENEVATAKAEAQKTIIKAQAKAKANDIVSKSLTTKLIRFEAIGKWNGELPRVTGKVVPFISVDNK